MASMSSMLISENNLRSAAGGFIGAKSGAITGITGEGPIFGLRNCPYQPPGSPAPPTVNRPMAITQMRIRFIPTVVFTAAQNMILEMHKTTCTANLSTGSPVTVLAQRKKFSGYLAIPETEIDIKIANTAILGGAGHTIQGSDDAPFEMGGAFGVSPGFETIWTAEDGIPLVLEENEGLLLHVLNAMGAGGAGHVFVGIDFFRF